MIDEEVNKQIAEWMGLCWHEWLYRNNIRPKGVRCFKCGEMKRHSEHNPDYCSSDTDIRKARDRVEKLELQAEFRSSLYLIVGTNEIHRWTEICNPLIEQFDLIHSTPRQQAEAIVRVIEEGNNA